ncbi:RNA polymerase sigma factor [Streptomyces yangpuensis]|uniref:RNA polymerase sigma factor n=1 Tax=Streptomyces yangpuensis TaxID=1648182 RepID=UPI003652A813
MNNRTGDDFDALLEASSLGGQEGRQVREQTSDSQAQTVREVIELRDAHNRNTQGNPSLPIEFQAFYFQRWKFFNDFAALHLGSLSAAEEAAHEAFLSILTKWKELLGEDNLEGRAFQILSQCIAKRIQANEGLEQKQPSIRTLLERESDTGKLYRAILELPSRQYEIIVLHYILNYPISQVARCMGLHSGTVRSQINIARRRLRSIFESNPNQ